MTATAGAWLLTSTGRSAACGRQAAFVGVALTKLLYLVKVLQGLSYLIDSFFRNLHGSFGEPLQLFNGKPLKRTSINIEHLSY